MEDSVKESTVSFAKGADVGWLDQMEKTGYKFYDDYGVEKDCVNMGG